MPKDKEVKFSKGASAGTWAARLIAAIAGAYVIINRPGMTDDSGLVPNRLRTDAPDPSLLPIPNATDLLVPNVTDSLSVRLDIELPTDEAKATDEPEEQIEAAHHLVENLEDLSKVHDLIGQEIGELQQEAKTVPPKERGRYLKAVEGLRILQQQCRLQMRMIVDSSGSETSQWPSTQQLQDGILEGVNISPSGSSASVIAFSNYISIVTESNDLSTLESAINALPHQGGGTKMGPAVAAAYNQITSTASVNPDVTRVVTITSDFMVQDEALVRSNVASIVSFAAANGLALKMEFIAVAGLDGINDALVDSLAAQYPGIVKVRKYPSEQGAIQDIATILSDICPPIAATIAPTGAPTKAPAIGATPTPTIKGTPTPTTNVTEPVPPIVPPTVIPPVVNCTYNSTANSTGFDIQGYIPTIYKPEDCNGTCLPWCIWLPGIRKRTVEEEEEVEEEIEEEVVVDDDDIGDIEDIGAEGTAHFVTRERGNTVDLGQSRTKKSSIRQKLNEHGVPWMNTGLITTSQKDKYDQDLGAGDTAPIPPPPAPREPRTKTVKRKVMVKKPVKKVKLILAPYFLITAGTLLAEHGLGTKHRQVLEVTPAQIKHGVKHPITSGKIAAASAKDAATKTVEGVTYVARNPKESAKSVAHGTAESMKHLGGNLKYTTLNPITSSKQLAYDTGHLGYLAVAEPLMSGAKTTVESMNALADHIRKRRNANTSPSATLSAFSSKTPLPKPKRPGGGGGGTDMV